MSLQIVGNENLPNVFIDSIAVRNTSLGIKVFCNLCLYDHSKIQGRSWYRDDLDLKIKVCLVSNTSKISSLVNGEESLFNDNNLLQTRIVNKLDLSMTEKKFDLEKYVVNVEFNEFIVKNPPINLTSDSRMIMPENNLNVFASCFVDGFGFENDLFNEFYGPLVGEKILVNGQINKSSGFFVNALTLKEYSGPVHVYEGSYYQGSIHTSDSEELKLLFLEEENYKISSINNSISNIRITGG